MNVHNTSFEESLDVQIMLVCKNLERKVDVVFAHIRSDLHNISSCLEVLEKNLEVKNNTVKTVGDKVDEINMNLNTINE